MERVQGQEQIAQELVDTLLQREGQVVEQVRSMLQAHQERRVELRRELHALFSQFGQFPEPNNVRHLRLVKPQSSDDADSICI